MAGYQGQGPSGAKLFVSANRRNFNRRLKAILAKMAAPQAARYISQAFRRCSAHEMNETRSRLSAIASAGTWRSDAAKGYIDMAANVEANVRHLFLVDSESESDKEVRPKIRDNAEIPSPARLGRVPHGYRGFRRPISSFLLSNSSGAG